MMSVKSDRDFLFSGASSFRLIQTDMLDFRTSGAHSEWNLHVPLCTCVRRRVITGGVFAEPVHRIAVQNVRL